MANQIDQLPYFDPLVKRDTFLISNLWMSAFSAFIENINGYLTEFGDLIPIITTAQRGTIQSPQEGQMIYNIDATPGPPRSADLQIWQVKAGVGAWRSITTTP